MKIETIFIVGPAASGKSAFAKLLSDYLLRKSGQEWEVADTSEPLYFALASIHAAGPQQGPDSTNIARWEDFIRARKEMYRLQLVRLADILRSRHPTFLLDSISRLGAIITGVRKVSEIRCGSRDFYIYIERPGFPSIDDGFEAERFRGLANATVINRGNEMGALGIQAEMIAGRILNGGGE